MLTVDYGLLGLRPGDRVLDLGCGAGRHAFECLRRGARVVAIDEDAVELKGAGGLMQAMAEAGEVSGGGAGAAVRGDALTLPFGEATFDRVIAAEVLEHIPRDGKALHELARVLRPGGTLAVTVPRYGPELVNWALSDAYHSKPGGHIRIYRRSQLLGRVEKTGLRRFAGHHAHALHSPYWWLRCLVGVDRDQHPLVRAYHQVLVWDIVKAPRLTRVSERLLNPVIGKSLVLYFEKPSPALARAAAPPSRSGAARLASAPA